VTQAKTENLNAKYKSDSVFGLAIHDWPAAINACMRPTNPEGAREFVREPSRHTHGWVAAEIERVDRPPASTDSERGEDRTGQRCALVGSL
jgi:hypothetical protein